MKKILPRYLSARETKWFCRSLRAFAFESQGMQRSSTCSVNLTKAETTGQNQKALHSDDIVKPPHSRNWLLLILLFDAWADVTYRPDERCGVVVRSEMNLKTTMDSLCRLREQDNFKTVEQATAEARTETPYLTVASAATREHVSEGHRFVSIDRS